MKTAAIILAAGASSRMGGPKQMLRLGPPEGETLLERALRLAWESGLDPLVIVLGAHAGTISRGCDLRRAWVVVNAAWNEGMASSVRAGVELVRGFEDVGAAVVMTCDMPAITAEHLGALMATGAAVAASAYAGGRGVPAFFDATHWDALMKLTGDEGARELLREAVTVELPGGELDVDTPETFAAAQRWVATHA